jgi:hypothetical protein
MRKLITVLLMTASFAAAQTKVDLPTQSKGSLDQTRVTGVVKSINGQSPDSNGAITINTGSGNVLLNGTSLPSNGSGIDGDFYLRTTTSCLYGPKSGGAWPGSCTSLIGPQGPTGSTGSTGSTGPAGSNGTNGNTVLNGSGAPGSGTGVNGDYYLRSDTTSLYGPKSGGAWPGSPTSLVGPTGSTGASGTNGNSVLNGTGAPGSGTGINGDYYLRNDTSCLYGPKAAGAWPGTCTSLIGPQGPAGTAAAGGSTLQLQGNNAGNLGGVPGSQYNTTSGAITLQPQSDAGYVMQCFNGTNTVKVLTVKDKTGVTLFDVDCVTGAVTLAGGATTGSGGSSANGMDFGVLNAGCLTYEGATADANEGRLCPVDPTADRLWNLPDADSTMVQPFTGTSNHFVTQISAQGVVSHAQPAFSNISGTCTVAQGCTGLATLTAHAVQVGAGTSNVVQVGPDASSTKFLASAGASADPAFRVIATADLPATSNIRSIGCGMGSPTGSALTTSETCYVVVPYACTIAGYNILVDAGTATIKTWRKATGTAIPTVSDSISTSGVAISTGTALHSSTVSDWTSTAVSANDIIAFNLSAVATAKFVYFSVQCNQ